MATADSPYGPWSRQDVPLLPTKPNTFYSYFTSNPSPVIHEDGSVLMLFKARSYIGNSHRHSLMSIGVARAPNIFGPYTIDPEPIFGHDKGGVIEDPSIWKDEDGYHMLAKDMSDAICGENNAGVLAHSVDGSHWEYDKEPLAYSKTVHFDDGSQTTFGHMERVFPLVEDGKITTLFFAVMDGPGGFENSTENYNIAVPLA